MNIIVAADKNWGIGYQGDLLVSIPADQKMFREETMGKIVVMGRKTLDSLPGGQPLCGRTNLILSREKGFFRKGAEICHSVEEAFAVLRQFRSQDIFIAGGQSIYEAFLPYCDTVHLTYIDYCYTADTFFPNLEENGEWKLKLCSEEQTYFDLCYEFRMYTRVKNLKKF